MLRQVLRQTTRRRLTATPSLSASNAIPPPPPLDLFDDDILNDLYSPPNPHPPPPTTPPDIFLYNRKEQLAYHRQLALEEQVTQVAVERFRKLARAATSRGDVVAHRPAADLLTAWYAPLTVCIRNSLGGTSVKRKNRRVGRRKIEQEVVERLAQISPEEASVLTIHVALSELMREGGGVPLTRLAMLVGNAVRAEINMKKLTALKKQLEKKGEGGCVDQALKRAREGGGTRISAVNYAAQQVEIREARWSERETVLIGTTLLDLLVRVGKVEGVEGMVDGFEHVRKYRGRDKCQVGVLQMSDAAMRIIAEDGKCLADCVSPKQQPMVVRPRPWGEGGGGPYLRCDATLIRTDEGGELEKALCGADLTVLYEGLNALGDMPWRVNEGVLEAAEKVWESGGARAGLVSRTDVKVPEKKEYLERGEGALRRYKVERRKALKMNRELVSMRADVEHKMEHARRFRDEERIWLPHNVDFRGRAYPIPVYLQHMGCDLTRAVLTFSKPGVVLGERGLYWLKVHLASKLGKDKLSFKERVEVAEDNMSRAIQVGRDPLNDEHMEWWTEAEDPFQLLAVCQEMAEGVGRWGGEEALKGFASSLPISMDGSCNGLQHYAALGRDVMGGEQVNLVPNTRPQDVYSGVAKLVNQRVEELAAQGDEIAQLLQGKVSRKVVKQTVMTSVYGVTLIGARQQIGNRLAEIPDFPEDKLFTASIKLASLTLSSLGDIFSGATRTMEWLYDAASRIAKTGRQVQWTTPVGLPVVQPYRKNGRVVVRTLMQRVTLERGDENSAVSTTRQRSAFAPNFVHSIDSAHMLLTAIACRKQGLAFAAVHDSFWTHAAHVDRMNDTLRDQFVSLHSRDLLQQLRESFLFRYPGIAFPDLPPRGDLQLDVVRDSPYFFS